MISKKTLIFVAASALSASACAPKPFPPANDSIRLRSLKSEVDHSALDKLQGHWMTGCLADPTRAPMRRELAVERDAITELDHEFDDTDCSREVRTTRYEYESGEVNVFTEPAGKGIDVQATVKSVEFTPRAGYAEVMNHSRACDRADWRDNDTRDVNGLQCGSFTYPAAGGMASLFFDAQSDALSLGPDRFAKRH